MIDKINYKGKDIICRKSVRPNHKYLKRFLNSNLGRTYDKVYSDLCRRIKTDFDRYHLDEALSYQTTKGDFTIDENGILQRRQKFSKILSLTSPTSSDILHLENRNQLRRIDGIWYGLVVDFADFKGEYDFLLKKKICYSDKYELESEYGTISSKTLYCCEKKQLNKKELQAYGLKNKRTA